MLAQMDMLNVLNVVLEFYKLNVPFHVGMEATSDKFFVWRFQLRILTY